MITPLYLHQALSARFPSTDFMPYFTFIKSLPLLKDGHKHHILPKKEFPKQAKNSDNLIRVASADHFRAHYWLALCAPQCQSFQVAFYLMANKKSAPQITGKELYQYAEIFARGREAQTAVARINAGIQGRKNVENGSLAKSRKNIKSGHIQALGRIQGCKNTENGHFARITTPESRAKGGRVAGHKRFNLHGSPATPESRRKGGLIAGYMAAENGQLNRALHTRWHKNRNIINANCSLCRGGC
jgi:hypothetical protein